MEMHKINYTHIPLCLLLFCSGVFTQVLLFYPLYSEFLHYESNNGHKCPICKGPIVLPHCSVVRILIRSVRGPWLGQVHYPPCDKKVTQVEIFNRKIELKCYFNVRTFVTLTRRLVTLTFDHRYDHVTSKNNCKILMHYFRGVCTGATNP